MCFQFLRITLFMCIQQKKPSKYTLDINFKGWISGVMNCRFLASKELQGSVDPVLHLFARKDLIDDKGKRKRIKLVYLYARTCNI